MENTIISKLTLIIESTNYKSISSEVMNRIDAFEKSITSHNELKLSFALNENQPVSTIKNKNADYISPANWDYWQV